MTEIVVKITACAVSRSVAKGASALFAIFYVLTALAAVTYFRRRIFSRAGDAVVLGLLPLGSAGFLVWMVERSLATAPLPERWSMAGVVGAGLVLMLVARFLLRSPFFQISRETAPAAGRDRA